MTEAGIANRLRVTGIVLVATIAFMAVALAFVLEFRFATSPVRGEVVNRSALRATETMTILNAAARARTDASRVTALEEAIGRLAVLQDGFSDLQAAETAEYDAFLASARAVASNPSNAALQAALDERGRALETVFLARSAEAAKVQGRQRAAVRATYLIGFALILVTLAVLYAGVMRPRHKSVMAAVEQLEERRRRFSAMFDGSDVMMGIYGSDGRLEEFNRSAAARLGLRAEHVGTIVEWYTAPGDRALVRQHFAAAARGEGAQFPATMIDAAGREFPAICSLQPIVVRGRVTGVTSAARDVSTERHYEAELIRSRERFRSLFENNANAIISIDAEGVIVEANPAIERLSGFSRAELVGSSILILVPPGNRDAALARVKDLMTGPPRSYLAPMQTRDGREMMVAVDASPIVVAGRVEGIFYTSKDFEADRALRRTIEEKDARVHALLQVASSAWDARAQIDQALLLGAQVLGMKYGFLIAITGEIMTVRHRFGTLDILPVGTTMRMTQSIGKRLIASARALAIDDLGVEPYASELAERKLPWKSYIGSHVRVDGVPYGALVFLHDEMRGVPFDDADLDFVDVLATMIGSAVMREVHDERLRDRAAYDNLTGLPNRSILEEHCQRMIARARRTKESFAIHFIDLNGFKPINDRYGHAAGDEVLCEVARRLSELVRGEDVVARLGGDEFVLLQAAAAGDSAVGGLRERLEAALTAPVRIADGVAVPVSASTGAAVFPADGQDLATLLRVADAEMYKQKAASR